MCQMAAYSVPANLDQDNNFKLHIVLGPRYYYACSKCASRHKCGPAMSNPANCNIIYVRSKRASQHICGPTMSDPANHNMHSKCSS